MTATLPTHHRALVVENVGADLQVKTFAVPQPTLGAAVVRVESAGILSYQREIYDGTRKYDFPLPLVAGMSAIGRVAAVGADAVRLQPGQLIFVDCTIRARDDPHIMFLLAIHEGGTPQSKKLARDVWRDGSFAEYVRVPLENCFPLDETSLCGKLSYTLHDLAYMACLLVPFGGLRSIGLQPGELLLVATATGNYGGAGVLVGLAMGARVIAMGRNETELERLKDFALAANSQARLTTLYMTGDELVDADALHALGPLDAVLDLSPPHAAHSSHVRSAVRALRKGGRVSLMGFQERPGVAWDVVSKDISFKGKLMYEREDVELFVKMLEGGLFPRGKALVESKVFGLEEWREGFKGAAEWVGGGRQVVFEPGRV